MKKILFTLVILVLGFLLFFLLYRSNMAITKHDALLTSLESNLKSSLTNHFALGLRNDSGGSSIADLKEFEIDFTNLMKNNSTLSLKETEKKVVEYLIEDNKGNTRVVTINQMPPQYIVKAVKVIYTMDNQEYSMRYIIDENEKPKNR